MYRFQWTSDIHLDSVDENGFNLFIDSLDSNYPLFISGDISNSRRIVADIQRISSKTETHFVMGNHDFYHSSINEMRRVFRETQSYLPNNPVVFDNIAMIGVDGWADGNSGDFYAFPDAVNDYKLINDFSGKSFTARKHLMENLAYESVFYLDKLLREYEATTVIVFTHVPPYAAAHYYNNQVSNSAITAHFINTAMGDYLTQYALDNPEKSLTVMCGHTHGASVINMTKNLKIIVNGARYQAPTVSLFEIEDNYVHSV